MKFGMSQRIIAGLLCISTLALSACGTIVHGTTQQFAVTSEPPGATVEIDGVDQGETPLTTEVGRKNKHTLRLALDGYQPEEMIINRTVSGWVFGNIIFGGLIGLAVDATTGGMYKLSPEEVNAQLEEETMSARVQDSRVFVTVVMQANPEWERVGTLTPEGSGSN